MFAVAAATELDSNTLSAQPTQRISIIVRIGGVAMGMHWTTTQIVDSMSCCYSCSYSASTP